MYQLRYEGSFLSHSDVSWKVKIFQVAEEAFPEVGELRFDAEEPLVVEWEDVKKQGTVQGSTLTLQLDSPSDREYVHLYTISPRGVQVRVFRQEVLWWVGVMDSELYEEPYERENHYTVTLTFSDFAIADRLLLDQTGTVTLFELLSSLFKRGALYTTEGDSKQEMEEEFLDRLDTSLISTTLPEEEEAKLTPQRVAVSVSSFKEDEEEPETLRGALEKAARTQTRPEGGKTLALRPPRALSLRTEKTRHLERSGTDAQRGLRHSGSLHQIQTGRRGRHLSGRGDTTII